MLGVAPGINGSWRGFLYAGKLRGKCELDGFDVSNSFEWKATDGVVVAIDAGQLTSC